jgi:hypothetical protein
MRVAWRSAVRRPNNKNSAAKPAATPLAAAPAIGIARIAVAGTNPAAARR